MKPIIHIYIYIIFVWEKKKRNEIDDTNGFPFLMLKLYAWCNVENPFTDSLYTDNMFSLIFFFTYYIMDILMHNEVYIWIPFKFLYFCCCFAFIQEYRLKNICLFWSVVILALFNVNEKNLGKPSYILYIFCTFYFLILRINFYN